MAMVCPQCYTTYEQRWQCPLCDRRLLFHDIRFLPESSQQWMKRWRQRPWGRTFIGLIFAQGLFYGLRHLVTAGLLASQGREAVEQMWTAAAGILLLQGMRMFSLLGGAILATAGQPRAAFLGAMIGCLNGLISVLLPSDPVQVLTPTALLGQPLLQAVIGSVGGYFGAGLWNPLSAINAVEPAKPRSRRFLRRNRKLFGGPVAWVRVVAGVILAVAGTLTATLVFEELLDISNGTLATADELQDRLITLEIKALAILFGGALAGATTRNGFKQGFWVGLASTVILVAIEMSYVKPWLQMAAYTALAAFSLSVAGGWFGSQLFPPIIRSPRRRGLRNTPN